MQKIIAVEPGSLKSAYVVIVDGKPIASAILPNEELFEYLRNVKGEYICIMELLPVAGIPFAEHIFRTCVWLGKFEAAAEMQGMHTTYVGRTEAAYNLCGKGDATVKMIRRALIRRFATHDKNTARGTKSNPDTLYCVNYEAMMALAYAVTWMDKHNVKAQRKASYENLQEKALAAKARTHLR